MKRIAVALHEVEPATFERCALIRDWLDDHGVDRVTLFVVPAPTLHPFADCRPELAVWLTERARRGDAVAQLGLEHRCGEFDGMAESDARRALLSGRRLLRLAGVEPHGFVAPGYAYTGPLRAALRSTSTGGRRLPACTAARCRCCARRCCGPGPRCSPARCCGSTCTRPTSIAPSRAFEQILQRARGREAVTYDELSHVESSSSASGRT